MSAGSLPPADRALVRGLRREVRDRLGALLAADAVGGRARMSADAQRRCTVQLVRQAVAQLDQARLGLNERQALEMEVLRAQFGFGGLRRLLADLAPSERSSISEAAVEEIPAPGALRLSGLSAGTGGRTA